MADLHFSDDQPLNDNKNLPVRSQPAPLDRPTRRVSRTTVVPEKSENVNFGPAFLLWVFQQWWKIAVPVGLVLAVVAGAAIWALHVNQYSASALIRIEHSAPFIAFSQGRVNATRQQLHSNTVRIAPQSNRVGARSEPAGDCLDGGISG